MNLGGLSVRWSYKNNATTCHIINGDQEIISRTTKVRHGDVKEKQIGRFLAFRKSMNHLIAKNENGEDISLVPRQQRTEMWNDFKQQIKSPLRVNAVNAVNAVRVAVTA
jgi:6-phosphogluconolactonase (cycloisomerase 2 family)